MTEVKYSFFKSFSKPILYLTDNFLLFLKYASVVGLFLTFLSFVFGQSFLCMIPDISAKTNIFCSGGTSYFIYFIFKLFVLSVFIKIWYDALYLKNTINLEYLKANALEFLKIFGILILFMILNTLPIASLFLLLYRKPNPVWQIELIYFTVVSIGFIIPFVLARFYTNIAEFIEKTDYKNFKQVYQKTSFKSGKIILSLTFILLIGLFLFVLVQSNLKIHTFEPLRLYNILSEFIFELTILFIEALFINFIRVQKELITGEI